MNATKSSVKHGLNLSTVFEKGIYALALLRDKGRQELISDLDKALQAFKDGKPFSVSVFEPKTFAEFFELSAPSHGRFNQLASELKFWELLDQIEESCFWNPRDTITAQPFISELWKDEIAQNPFQPPKGWKYLPVAEAVEAYRKIFGSSLRADSVFAFAKAAKQHAKSEGVPVWPKLSALAKIFGVSGNPLENSEEGRKAYAEIVEKFVPEVGRAYMKAYPQFGFRNWRENQLASRHIILTPAGRKAWRDLQANFIGGDDFVVATAGANTGSLYAGYTVRRSRLCIVLASNQFPQDCVMAGSTIMIQPDRLTKYEYLGMDCPGNAYFPAADGDFERCLYWSWSDGGLRFGSGWAAVVHQRYGSAVGFLS